MPPLIRYYFRCHYFLFAMAFYFLITFRLPSAYIILHWCLLIRWYFRQILCRAQGQRRYITFSLRFRYAFEDSATLLPPALLQITAAIRLLATLHDFILLHFSGIGHLHTAYWYITSAMPPADPPARALHRILMLLRAFAAPTSQDTPPSLSADVSRYHICAAFQMPFSPWRLFDAISLVFEIRHWYRH